MTSAAVPQRVQFAGLAPDARRSRGGGDLAGLQLDNAIAASEQLRQATSGVASVEALALAILEAVNAFDQEGRPACVLVRAFATDEIGKNMRLVGTVGIEPSWNDKTTSEPAAHLIADLGRLLRLDDLARSPVTSFHISDPLSNPAVIAGKEFLQSYDVRVIFGFATVLDPTTTLIVKAFARVDVPRETTRLFELFGLYAKLGWIANDERGRSETLEQLVRLHAILAREAIFAYRRRVDAAAVAAREAADAAASIGKTHAQEQRRSQRAMLNVIEDLREARSSLESTVELRTRQLAARNQELEEFVYIASHDLQEPLRTVSGYLQMIERRYGAKLGPEGDEFIRFAIDGAQRMQALIESLLVYSRVATVERQIGTVPLDEPLDAALKNLAVRIEETDATIVRGKLPAVPGDRIQLIQVFQNLVGNALKFAGPNPPRIEISATVAEGVAVIAVGDEGIGFDPKFRDRIFKVFRRLRRDSAGTGIGLAVCKKIVERHGGRISAASEPGRGATFTFELPIDASEKRP